MAINIVESDHNHQGFTKDEWSRYSAQYEKQYREKGYSSDLHDDLESKVWYSRHRTYPDCDSPSHPGYQAARELEEKYGRENLGPYDCREWDDLCCRLLSLRRTMGCGDLGLDT